MGLGTGGLLPEALPIVTTLATTLLISNMKRNLIKISGSPKNMDGRKNIAGRKAFTKGIKLAFWSYSHSPIPSGLVFPHSSAVVFSAPESV